MDRTIKELNEELKQLLNEMSLVNGTIEVNNEDIVNDKGEVQTKFAHFHWVYKRKIHFKFSNRMPKNITELKKLFAFKNDAKMISDKELKNVLKDLKAIIPNGLFKDMTTFDGAKEQWIQLHPNRDLNKELINLD